MFFNISNHQLLEWPKEQRGSALKLGNGAVREIPLSRVDTDTTTAEIIGSAKRISKMVPNGAIAMVVGEYSLVYSITKRLRARGIRVVVPCHERLSKFELQPDGSSVKTSVFVFEGWRDVE